MKNKAIRFKFNRNRVILTDILPYEIPIIFTNKYYFEFLNDIEKKLMKSNIKIEYSLEDIARIPKMLNNTEIKIINILFEEINKQTGSNCYAFEGKGRYKNRFTKIPFNFNIYQKGRDFRNISVIHPLNQLQITHFYEKYKYLIIYLCSQSPFSIRKSVRVAKSVYMKNNISSKRNKPITMSGEDSEQIKSFFVINNNQIYKFFESYKFHKCEKKYDKMLKFDISHCFDSIYTHSIEWALFNKDIVKENMMKTNMSFGHEFDELMQNVNYGETNGIVIGPEFSRIFAEILLQQIDIKVYKEL